MSGPVCHCCGRDSFATGDLRRVGAEIWSCQKHLGRIPCCVPGCGRTFKLAPGEDYSYVVMCGDHWRMAPKYMRNAVARVRRQAKKRGWTDAMQNRHSRLWHRCKRAVIEPRIDMSEIDMLVGS